jgi:hypothetical protein
MDDFLFVFFWLLVENEKDFALPTKKLKVDKDGLIHKTDSGTKS